MLDSVLVRHADIRLPLRHFIQQAVNLLIEVLIQHEDLLEVRPRMPQQLESILFRSAQRTLVWKHNLIPVIFEPAQGDEPLANSSLLLSWNTEPLEIDEDGRRR